MNEEITKLLNQLINTFGEGETLRAIRRLHRNAPDPGDDKELVKQLEKLGIARDIEVHSDIEQHQVHTHTSKYGPCIIISVTPRSPFTVLVEMKDSYYEPRDIYDLDCGPSYYDKEEKAWFTNENWSPVELFSAAATFKEAAEIYPWIKAQVDAFEVKWGEMAEWRGHDEGPSSIYMGREIGNCELCESHRESCYDYCYLGTRQNNAVRITE